MNTSELNYEFPFDLIATEPKKPSRVMWVSATDQTEITKGQLLQKFTPGDVLVINESKVIKRRVFSQKNLEVLFIEEVEPNIWEVLFPSSRIRTNEKVLLPEFVEMELIQRGRPQLVKVSKKLHDDYFVRNGELPLPPYIQKARNERRNRNVDETLYQTAWAKTPGSLAAPTASLHFSNEDLQNLQKNNVEILRITLHVGLGTFLPMSCETLQEHQMHKEVCEITDETWQKIQKAKAEGRKIWGMGTTTVRTLESMATGKLKKIAESYRGSTDLFIYPGYDFQVVDRLLTNFHQPQTTLLALVAAFVGKNRWQKAYEWAINKRFRLFSYGDLSVWEKA